MKKTGLFKIIMFILLGIVVLTWLFSASYFNEGNLAELGMYNVGFFDYFSLIFGAFQFEYFLQIFILLISIGALYGVLGKTGKYRAWIEKIANNFKGAEFIFLLVIAFVIVALTSIFDYGFALLIFFPFIISIILAMGYDKVTALVATVGSMLVGTIGNIMGSSTSGVISGLVGVSATAGIYYKLGLLVFSFCALILYLSKAKRIKSTTRDEEDDMFIGEKISNKYSIVSIIVVFSLVFLLLILGCTKWTETFKVDSFSKLHETVTTWSPKLPYIHVTSEKVETGRQKVALVSKVFGNVSAFGEWHFTEMAVICFVAAFVLGLLYRVKDIFSAMGEGAKKMLKPAFLVMMAYTVVYFAGNQMFFPTIARYILGISKHFSVLLSSFVMIIGSALHVDILYAANYVVPQISATASDNVLVALLTQGIYGVTMFIAPTSALLIFGLSYLEIPYKEWVKRTWKLTLMLFAIVMVILLIMKFI